MITLNNIKNALKDPTKVIKFIKYNYNKTDESKLPKIIDIKESKKLYLKGGIRHKFYGLEDNEMRDKMRKFCRSLHPESVFEFGCNVGMNLKEILPQNHYGIDINTQAISKGKEMGLNIEVGDETTLDKIPSNSYDLVLTSSVLDHIPQSAFDDIFANLKRITKRYMVCFEANEDSGIALFIHDYKDMKILWSHFSAKPKGNGALYHNYFWKKNGVID
jgi:2-polyprenyl-3-methyl-5-hydroxy-6-metoxy-1,4-benzoquinol methylase